MEVQLGRSNWQKSPREILPFWHGFPIHSLYVETKSSRPEEIEDTDIKRFLRRGVELAPDLPISLVDTDDDLEESGFLHKVYGLTLLTIA